MIGIILTAPMAEGLKDPHDWPVACCHLPAQAVTVNGVFIPFG